MTYALDVQSYTLLNFFTVKWTSRHDCRAVSFEMTPAFNSPVLRNVFRFSEWRHFYPLSLSMFLAPFNVGLGLVTKYRIGIVIMSINWFALVKWFSCDIVDSWSFASNMCTMRVRVHVTLAWFSFLTSESLKFRLLTCNTFSCNPRGRSNFQNM